MDRLMDRMRDFDNADHYDRSVVDDDQGIETPMLGGDERRMHVRAYNYWVSLLNDRAFPSVEDLDCERNEDFGPNSVLLDFTASQEKPSISWLGDKLRGQCQLPPGSDSVQDVPTRSLLSRLTDHYMQIIANRAPVGFEAEFVNDRGNNTFYRGILMPFSSDDDTIDFVYGVINWKEAAEGELTASIEAEISAAVAMPHYTPQPVWADGPSAEVTDDVDALELTEENISEPAPDAALADWLANARASASAMNSADARSRSTLYRALGHAYDFSLIADVRSEEYSELLTDSGLKAQERAPMTPVVKLVFGAGYDKTRLTEFAAALSYARRHALPQGGMRHFLDQYPGGLKAIVSAERRERRPEGRLPRPDHSREAARALPPQAVLSLPGEDEFVLMVARRVDGDRVAIIGVVPDEKSLMDRALKTIIE